MNPRLTLCLLVVSVNGASWFFKSLFGANRAPDVTEVLDGELAIAKKSWLSNSWWGKGNQEKVPEMMEVDQTAIVEEAEEIEENDPVLKMTKQVQDLRLETTPVDSLTDHLKALSLDSAPNVPQAKVRVTINLHGKPLYRFTSDANGIHYATPDGQLLLSIRRN